MQVNQQPIEKFDRTDDGTVDIVGIWRTIQGEGPFAGQVAVFVRMAGCDLLCPACDTQYTIGRKRRPILKVVEEVEKLLGQTANLVVITGGEPFRQRSLAELCFELLGIDRSVESNVRVQIETNGTLFMQDMPWGDPAFDVVCSPKTGTIHPQLVPYLTALKYVVEAGKVDPEDGLPLSVLGNGVRPDRPAIFFEDGDIRSSCVYVQPMDSQDSKINADNTKAAVESCMKFGYRLCLQTHKMVGLD